MISPRSLTSAGILASCLLLAVLASPSHGAEPTIEIRSSVVQDDGSVRAVVAVDGLPAGTRLTADRLAIIDTRGTIDDVTVGRLGAGALSVALVVDTSSSTSGRPIASAIDASKRFVASLPAGTTFSVIATGAPTRVVQRPTTDAAAVRLALDGLRAGGGAALYDGMLLAATTLADTNGQRNAVIVSNGRDTVSVTKMRVGVDALAAAKVGTTVIGLATPDYGGNQGSITVARATGGKLVSVTASTGLAGALTTVAESLSSQYAVEYTVSDTSLPQFDLRIGLVGSAAADAVTLLAPAAATSGDGRAPLAPLPVADPDPWFAPFAEPIGLAVGLAAVFLAGLLLFAPVLLPAPEKEASRWLRRALALQRTSSTPTEMLDGDTASSLARAVDVVERRLPGRKKIASLQQALVRSGWPIRAAEFRVAQFGALLLGALFGAGIFRNWIAVLLLALTGALIPQFLLRRKIASRSAAFIKQLPAALDILASSLQAGLSFMQGLDSLVKELPDPASAEFGRVISEARLGMPVEESLEASASRINVEDYTWVVMAIIIQRQAGGNLSHLMRTVAATLRERAQVRQQIKVLSSEGRLSAAILIILPFLLAGYISVVNPGYIGKLFEGTIGQAMVVGALLLMGTGIAWMRKIIRIDI